MTVQCVNPFNVTQVVADGSTRAVRIEVTVFLNDIEVTRLIWIAMR